MDNCFLKESERQTPTSKLMEQRSDSTVKCLHYANEVAGKGVCMPAKCLKCQQSWHFRSLNAPADGQNQTAKVTVHAVVKQPGIIPPVTMRR